jgi:predicted ATPase
MKAVRVSNFGPIKDASIEFGDLTVLVGPQATGKSLFLQLLKLLVDVRSIRDELRCFNLDWDGSLANLQELYFGEGMSGLYDGEHTQIEADGKAVALPQLIGGGRRDKQERLFYIPAQRVLSLREGLTRPFTDYRAGDPFVVREFGERLHFLVQSEFARSTQLFPQAKRLKSEFRDLLSKHIFGGFGLKTDAERFQKRIVLISPSSGASLPYLVWSAGQREFVPLLLGLYWLIPPTKVSRRGNLEWVVIEELEMGLHPNSISVVMLLVLELLHRGYKVCMSTHSPHVLDVVWALQVMKRNRGSEQDVRDLFSLRANPPTKALAESALGKEYRVVFFKRDGTTADISNLDPGAEDSAESGWGRAFRV